jgi:ComF family protein
LPYPPKHCPRSNGLWQIDAVVAPYCYSPPLYRQLHALKFVGARALGRALGLLLATELDKRRTDADLLVPVPLHRDRLIDRGYNQAGEIARTVSAELGIPLRTSGVVRIKATTPQSTLRSGLRTLNTAQAFGVGGDFGGRQVAIIDDVITTAATVNSLAGKLREAGAAGVFGWAVARTLETQRSVNSGTKYEIQENSGENGTTQPRVVQEGPEALVRLSVFDQKLLIHRKRSGDYESNEVPAPKTCAIADEHETDKQRNLQHADQCAIHVAEQYRGRTNANS